jgi:hypothetical protein
MQCCEADDSNATLRALLKDCLFDQVEKQHVNRKLSDCNEDRHIKIS